MNLQCTNKKVSLIIGHRGAKGHIAENTLPSIEKALELGVDGIEIDVFLCKSGELIVFHDKKLDRLTNTQGYIENLDYDSIKKIRVKGKYKIPTLNQVIELIEGNAFLNIELKGSGTAGPTHKLLTSFIEQKKWMANQFIISSFNWEELEIFYKLNQKIPIAILTGSYPLDAINIAKRLKALAINPNFKTLNLKNVKKIQKEGFKVFPYTINNMKDIEEMLNLEVDGIITDFPERVKKVLSSN
ncbi:MAG: glycerophosphodiester phosphodiesterase family protein [Bacteroidota bacterium]|nr:glycerophosphodiester phosphodiesterase family protein [Bacteroidota bacterium]